MAENDKEKDQKEKGKADQDAALLAKACEAYGIDPKYVFASNVSADGVVTILTNGGTRVKFRKGDKVRPLDPVAIDGISRKKPRIVMGKKKEAKEETEE
jgi:hypothetical protein